MVLCIPGLTNLLLSGYVVHHQAKLPGWLKLQSDTEPLPAPVGVSRLCRRALAGGADLSCWPRSRALQGTRSRVLAWQASWQPAGWSRQQPWLLRCTSGTSTRMHTPHWLGMQVGGWVARDSTGQGQGAGRSVQWTSYQLHSWFSAKCLCMHSHPLFTA